MILPKGAVLDVDGETIIMGDWNPTQEEFAEYRLRECQLAAWARDVEGRHREDCCYHPFSWAGILESDRLWPEDGEFVCVALP